MVADNDHFTVKSPIRRGMEKVRGKTRLSATIRHPGIFEQFERVMTSQAWVCSEECLRRGSTAAP